MELPRHLAIILDGNGRWAKAKGRPRSYGHKVGSDNLEHMCNVICDMGIPYLTVFAFSTENWKRSVEEVGILMNLFRRYLKKCIKDAHKNHMRVRIIGKKEELAPDIVEIIRRLEDESKDYDRMFLQIALNYGSRDEITRAVKRIAAEAKNGTLDPEAITEDTVSGFLDTEGVPDPDLLIRTSGEQRISNFLLWQLAYSEFYFTETPWPAFHEEELQLALEQYDQRDRRFGGIKGQTPEA